MSIPTYLSTSYDPIEFDEDVTPILDMADAYTKLTTMLDDLGWTNLSGTLWKTPLDAANRWFTAEFDYVSDAKRLSAEIVDMNGNIICERSVELQDTVTGNPVSYFAGAKHFLVMVHRTDNGIWEHLLASMLESSPGLDTTLTNFVVANGTRDGAGTADGGFANLGNLYMWTGAAAVAAERRRAYIDSASNDVNYFMTDGTTIEFDVMIRHTDDSSVHRWAGRIPMLIATPVFPFGTDHDVAVDTGTLADFRSLGFGTTGVTRFMMRKT